MTPPTLIQTTRGVFAAEIEYIENFGGACIVGVRFGGSRIHLNARTADLAPVIFAGWRQDCHAIGGA